MEHKALTIYKASAGSGKTFKLTQHYLSLALATEKNYQRILAITFTRKATAEMRQRIVAELLLLSHDPKASSHTQTLTTELEISQDELQARASKLLPAILHDYSNFSVTTIDQFFQRIIRNLTREMGLSGGYRIEMDELKILSRAVDVMLDKAAANPILFELVSEYIRHEIINESKSHMIHKGIVSFVKKMLREDLKNTFISMGNDKFDHQILSLQKEMFVRVKAFEKQVALRTDRMEKILSDNDLTLEDFSKLSNPKKFYSRLKMFVSKQSDIDVVFDSDFSENKGALTFFTTSFYGKNKAKLDAFAQQLFPIFEEDVQFFMENYPTYFLSKNARSRLWFIRFFGYIWHEMNQIKLDDNLFVIGDAPVLLSQIANEADSPFIFERIANNYNHFMIDEFQDTSTLQWLNLRPFLENSMSQFSPGRQKSTVNNLIVGDVKQAIYRFRNGNWTLLNEKVDKELGHLGIAQEVLNTNWRSEKTIIRFNNQMFSVLPDSISFGFLPGMPQEYRQYLKSIYANHSQNINPGKTDDYGFVHFETIQPDNYRNETINRVCQQVFDLLDNGVEQGEIAILVRDSKDGQAIATQLLAYNPAETGQVLQISMSDVLSIDKSIAVQVIIQTLYYLSNRDEDFYLWIAAWHVNQVLDKDTSNFFTLELATILPEEFFLQVDEIQRLPIYETVVRLIHLFELNSNKSEIPFLSRLLNLVIAYQQNNPPDRNSFLKYWEEEGTKVKIPAPATSNAIQIMTMHKSKGLEFEHVIIPFADWPIKHPGSHDIWITDTAGQNKISIPVPFNKTAEFSTYKDQLYAEYFDMIVDSVNILYVAFTRAVRSLIVFYHGKFEKNSVAEWLNTAFQFSKAWDGATSEPEEEGIQRFTMGKQHYSMGLKKKRMPGQELISSMPINQKLTVAVRSSNRIYPKQEDFVLTGLEYGTIMHRIMEQITTVSSLDRAIKRVAGSGQLKWDDISRIEQQIKTWITQPVVNEWFDESVQVFNEQVLLTPDGKLRRPDRLVKTSDERWIVIDYKFTHEQSPEHVEQIKQYVRILSNVGKKVDSAYLWYMVHEKIVKVF